MCKATALSGGTFTAANPCPSTVIAGQEDALSDLMMLQYLPGGIERCNRGLHQLLPSLLKAMQAARPRHMNMRLPSGAQKEPTPFVPAERRQPTMLAREVQRCSQTQGLPIG